MTYLSAERCGLGGNVGRRVFNRLFLAVELFLLQDKESGIYNCNCLTGFDTVSFGDIHAQNFSGGFRGYSYGCGFENACRIVVGSAVAGRCQKDRHNNI